MNKLYLIIFLFLIGCKTNDKSENQDSPPAPKEIILLDQHFDNFQIDSSKIAALSNFDISRLEKEKIVNQIRPEYDYLYQYEWSQPENPFVDHFLFIELNNDGKPDLIFQGKSGGEPRCIKIHFSKANGYESSIVFMQYLKSLGVENGKIKSLTMIDPGCCAEYVEQELTYLFDGNLNHEIVSHRARIGELDEKYEILKAPIRFEVQNDKYKLRGEPLIDDTGTFVYDYHELGNTVAIFKKGATGQAWAVDKSDPERDWWYVEMNPISDTLEFDMFNFYDTSELKRLGWMSSKYVERLK